MSEYPCKSKRNGEFIRQLLFFLLRYGSNKFDGILIKKNAIVNLQ